MSRSWDFRWLRLSLTGIQIDNVPKVYIVVNDPKLGHFLYQTKMCADPTLFMVHIIHHSLPLTFILITQETRSLKTFWGMRTKPWQFEKKSKLSSDTCWAIGQVTLIISHVIFCLCKLYVKGNYSRVKL